jgi:hypothetical protein
LLFGDGSVAAIATFPSVVAWVSNCPGPTIANAQAALLVSASSLPRRGLFLAFVRLKV